MQSAGKRRSGKIARANADLAEEAPDREPMWLPLKPR